MDACCARCVLRVWCVRDGKDGMRIACFMGCIEHITRERYVLSQAACAARCVCVAWRVAILISVCSALRALPYIFCSVLCGKVCV